MTPAQLVSSALRLILPVLLAASLGGCSVVMATKQPPKKDLSVLRPGTERDRVIAELGAPVSIEKVEAGKKEIYTFIQGYSTGAKVSRAMFHGAADVFTLGIWEAVGTPIEGAFDGKKISVRVIYDTDDKVKETATLSVSDP